MSGTESGPVTMPWKREHPCPFNPPAELDQLREEEPVTRLRFPDGHEGWLVTSYPIARQLLADNRFSARQDLRHFPIVLPFAEQTMAGPTAPPGFFNRMDPPEHTRYRRLLTGYFTVRRMAQLTPRLERIAEDHLDRIQAQEPPLDLMEHYAIPLPSLMICELLGVPYEDRDEFNYHAGVALSMESTPEQVGATLRFIAGYLDTLVRVKRAAPGDDMLSDLIVDGKLTDDEVKGVTTLFLAGHETTVNMIGMGVYALLTHPDQLQALLADPSLIEGTIEELLRFLAILNAGLTRGALEDVELGGQHVKAGETVVISVPAVNWDPARFPSPATMDITRPPTGHLTFGHGVHQCLGQQLVRIEMRIAYLSLFRRFPGLRLAVPAGDVPLRGEMTVHGVHRLPVAW
ncbi:cytochrome P450 [Micromonospora zamorensis]|uniref:cytochrome P450 n=1 Tax=Micromonospora zamorensis TaxID=709883 RepID=UPI00352B08A2|nr:cytochrome P450 [Micromonospora zamorensis]